MIPKIKRKQLLSVLNLLTELQDFEKRKYGRVSDVVTMVNPIAPGAIFVRYQKDYVSGGEPQHEFRIAQIGEDGYVNFIDDKFADMFARYNFLSECQVFNVEDQTNFEIID